MMMVLGYFAQAQSTKTNHLPCSHLHQPATHLVWVVVVCLCRRWNSRQRLLMQLMKSDRYENWQVQDGHRLGFALYLFLINNSLLTVRT